MKFYEFYMDTFKYSYTGYFSSIDKAIEMIPKCPSFQKALSWRKPGLEKDESHDYEHNKNLRVVLRHSDFCLEVRVPGYRITRTTYEDVPEVKEIGKPYQPFTRKKIHEETREIEANFGHIEIFERRMDELQND